MNYADGRRLANMIAHAEACGWLHVSQIGVTWSPRTDSGRHWPQRKAQAVLGDLAGLGYASVHESLTGRVVRTNETGFRFFDLAGAPALSDARAAWYFGDPIPTAGG